MIRIRGPLVIVLIVSWVLATPVLAHAYVASVPSPTPDGFVELTEQLAKEQQEKKEALEKQEASEEQSREAAEQKQREEQSHQAEAHLHEEAERGQQAARQAKEAEERAEQEVRHKIEVEQEAVRCVVPSLKGDSLRSARSLLLKDHCRLGKVSDAHGAHGHLVVVAQSVKGGLKRPAGATVAVTLGLAKRRR